MAKKIIKIVIDAVISFIVFILFAIIVDLIATKLFGTTANADGTQTVNMNGGVLLAITTVLTIGFAVWFYGVLTNYSLKKINSKE